MAGEFTLDKDGNITSISNQSGHYRPDADTFVKFLGALRDQNVPLNDSSHITPLGFKSAGASFDTETKTFDIHTLDRLEPNGMLKPASTTHEENPETKQGDIRQGYVGGGSEPDSAPPATEPVAQAGEPPLDEAARDALSERVRLEARTNPQVIDIMARVQHLHSGDQDAVDENLFSVLSYTDSPDHAPLRSQLLGEMQAGIRGPRPSEKVDAVTKEPFTEFPLLPQYVGENLPGLDNWHSKGQKAPTTYLTREQQDAKTVHIEDGKFRYPGGAVPEGKHIFVVTQDGRMIVDQPKQYVIHHSSLADGQPVRIAGEFTLDKNGNITSISNQSGHYRPDADTFLKFLGALRAQNVPLTQSSQVKPVGFETFGASFDTVEKSFDIHQLDQVKPNGMLQPGVSPHVTADHQKQTPPTTSLAPTWLRTAKQRIRSGSPEPLLLLAS